VGTSVVVASAEAATAVVASAVVVMAAVALAEAATAAVALVEAAMGAVALAVVATAAAELLALVALGYQSAGYRCIAPEKSIGVSHAVGRVSDGFPLGSVSTVASLCS
jgi:hypothetical protein